MFTLRGVPLVILFISLTRARQIVVECGDESDCTGIPKGRRVSCGKAGVMASTCRKEGCCFHDNECFYPKCPRPNLDVIFALDVSGSVSDASFNLEVDYIKNVSSQLKLGEKSSRVGIVSYSGTARIILALKDGTSIDNVDKAEFRNTGGWTNTAAGLQKATRIFRKVKRKSIKICIVITDAKTNKKRQRLPKAIQQLHSVARSIAVGVPGYNYTKLEELASNDQFVLKVEDFTGLKNIVEDLTVEICRNESAA